MAIDIEVPGIDALLGRYEQADIIDELEKPMAKSMELLVNFMADYSRVPAPYSGIFYRKTGTLARKWTEEVHRTGNGLEGVVGNDLAYGPFVQSAQFQAWMHQGRWQTDEDAMRELEGPIVDEFEGAIEALIAWLEG